MVKKIIRYFLIESFSLYIVSSHVEGIVFEEGVKTLFLAGLALTVATFLVKPVINLLLLPLNLVTFNLFRWISSAITLYIVTLIVPGFTIDKFFFPGYSSSFIDIPPIEVFGVLSFIFYSFLLSAIGSFFYWLVK